MDHLPPHARGMMGDLNEQQIVQIRQMLARALINPQKIG